MGLDPKDDNVKIEDLDLKELTSAQNYMMQSKD
jgi:hypothetical protein